MTFHNFKVNSLKFKLILFGIVNILMILTTTVLAVRLSRKTNNFVNTSVVSGVNSIASSSRLSRQMNSLMQRIDKITNYFIFAPDQFYAEKEVIIEELKKLRNKEFSLSEDSAKSFRFIEQGLVKVFVEAEDILANKRLVEDTNDDINKLFDSMEQNILDEMGDSTLNRQEYKRISLEKAAATVMYFRVRLLKIDHEISELYKVILVKDQYDRQKGIVARLMDEFEKTVASSAPVGAKHFVYVTMLKEYSSGFRDGIFLVDGSVGRFYEAFTEFNKMKEDFFAFSAEIERNIEKNSAGMTSRIAGSLSTAQDVTVLISAVGIVLIIVFWVWQGISILIPIDKVMNMFTMISKEIIEEKAERVELFVYEGDKEIAKLVASINVFISALNVMREKVKDREGALIETNAMLREEIDERRRAESDLKEAYDALNDTKDQLVQSEKMAAVGQLAAGIAHDFNNVLTAIINYAELVREVVAHDPSSKSDMEEIIKQARHAASLIHQLLAFSRRQIIDLRPIDTFDFLKSMKEVLRHLLRENVALDIMIDGRLEPVMADLNQIQRAMINLAVNACDAMPNGGRLLIEAANHVFLDTSVDFGLETKPGKYVKIAISDTGIGMSVEVQKHIFEPFYTTKGSHGTGLGLSSVYGIVKQHGGHIEVSSIEGQGTMFTVYLPVAMMEKEAVPVSDELSSESYTGDETVLLVEDNVPILEVTAAILGKLGYKVTSFSDPVQAISEAQKLKGGFDLLLTDVVMPQMSGKDLALKIQAIIPGIKVLYMTGYTEDVIVHNGILDKDIILLRKPFTKDTLGEKIYEALGKKIA